MRMTKLYENVRIVIDPLIKNGWLRLKNSHMHLSLFYYYFFSIHLSFFRLLRSNFHLCLSSSCFFFFYTSISSSPIKKLTIDPSCFETDEEKYEINTLIEPKLICFYTLKLTVVTQVHWYILQRWLIEEDERVKGSKEIRIEWADEVSLLTAAATAFNINCLTASPTL
jgi:hypothetical protein